MKLNALKTVAVIAAVIVALSVSLLVPLGNNGGGGTPRASEVAVTGVNGLQLDLSINTTKLNQGHSIGITVTLTNTLSTPKNISASTDSPFAGQTQACGNQIYPFGIAIFQGRYSDKNVSLAQPLQIFPSVACPLLIRYISGYYFLPGSDSASILPGSDKPVTMSTTIVVGGTYSGVASSQAQPLAPGLYTVAAADEWGLAAFLYVEVQ